MSYGYFGPMDSDNQLIFIGRDLHGHVVRYSDCFKYMEDMFMVQTMKAEKLLWNSRKFMI